MILHCPLQKHKKSAEAFTSLALCTMAKILSKTVFYFLFRRFRFLFSFHKKRRVPLYRMQYLSISVYILIISNMSVNEKLNWNSIQPFFIWKVFNRRDDFSLKVAEMRPWVNIGKIYMVWKIEEKEAELVLMKVVYSSTCLLSIL
jgi:hypothetical protein